MKNIWIIAPFTAIETKNTKNRFLFLADLMSKQGYKITLFTSTFSHPLKKQLDFLDDIKNSFDFDVIFVSEPGYQRNISVKRIFSHFIFSKNLKKIIQNKGKPKLIYCAYPTMSAASSMAKYCKENNVPFVLDVQDTWPESISVAINIEKWYFKLPLYPITLWANKIYKSADLLFAVSDSYCKRAYVRGSNAIGYHSVYIGADLKVFNKSSDFKVTKPKGEIWLIYIGTLSHSYDIETTIRAMKKLEYIEELKLFILGQGPDYNKLKELARNLNILDVNVFFKGTLQYDEMTSFLKSSDVAINAIKGSSKATFTNKLGDYLAAGLPILNSCSQQEIIDFIEIENIGYNYASGDVKNLAENILKLTGNSLIMDEMGKKAKLISELKFDRNVSYQKIINEVENLI